MGNISSGWAINYYPPPHTHTPYPCMYTIITITITIALNALMKILVRSTSCAEWCLSKGGGSCDQLFVSVRQV